MSLCGMPQFASRSDEWTTTGTRGQYSPYCTVPVSRLSSYAVHTLYYQVQYLVPGTWYLVTGTVLVGQVARYIYSIDSRALHPFSVLRTLVKR
jgi:hypothetical protein